MSQDISDNGPTTDVGPFVIFRPGLERPRAVT